MKNDGGTPNSTRRGPEAFFTTPPPAVPIPRPTGRNAGQSTAAPESPEDDTRRTTPRERRAARNAETKEGVAQSLADAVDAMKDHNEGAASRHTEMMHRGSDRVIGLKWYLLVYTHPTQSGRMSSSKYVTLGCHDNTWGY